MTAFGHFVSYLQQFVLCDDMGTDSNITEA